MKSTRRQIVCIITILSAFIQGVLMPGRIDEPYALDDTGGSAHSPSSNLPTLMRK